LVIKRPDYLYDCAIQGDKNQGARVSGIFTEFLFSVLTGARELPLLSLTKQSRPGASARLIGSVLTERGDSSAEFMGDQI